MSDIKQILDALYNSRSKEHLANDPLSFCHRYKNSEDIEVAAVIASSFAYGNVKIILRTLESIFAEMGDSPRKYIETFEPKQALKVFVNFKHRFNDGRDLTALLYCLKLMLKDSGSVQSFYMRGYNNTDKNITASLNSYVAAILSMNYSAVFGADNIPKDSYFPFFFPAPISGSACKRICMMLRWLVRPADGIDLGLWNNISPRNLIIPVDTHISRISRYLGFTTRKSADWRMAEEITNALSKFDPSDPVKYDFALAHLGISEGCDGIDTNRCRSCSINKICQQNISKS